MRLDLVNQYFELEKKCYTDFCNGIKGKDPLIIPCLSHMTEEELIYAEKLFYAWICNIEEGLVLDLGEDKKDDQCD